MTIRTVTLHKQTLEQRERSRSIVIAAAATAIGAILILSSGAHAAECAGPNKAEVSGQFDMGGRKMAPFKIVKTLAYPTIDGHSYREFEIQDWSNGKCAWSTRSRLVSEGHMHLEPSQAPAGAPAKQ